MARAKNIEGWRKGIGVAVDRKLLKRHSKNIENLAERLFNKAHFLIRLNEFRTNKNMNKI
jgi:hypothetical protein